MKIEAKKVIKFLVINASSFYPSITEGFCSLFEDSCKKIGTHTERFDLFKLPPEICYGTYDRPEVLSVYHKMILDCDGLFIATPCHWFNMPGALKNLIDHLTRIDKDLWEKSRPLCVAVHSPEGGEYGTLSSIILPMNMMGFSIPANGYAYFNGGDRWAYDEIKEFPKRMLEEVV